MTLQNHFNLKRFLNYFKYNFTMYGKTYLYFSIGLAIALFSLDFFTLNTAYYKNNFFKNNYIPMFFMLYAISGILVIGTSFPSLRNKNKIANYILLPVATFEKFLGEFIIRIIGFNLLFFPLFWLVFKMAYAFYHLFEWAHPLEIESFGIFSPFYGIPNTLDKFAVLSILSLSAFLFMGAAYFKKNALVKTIITFSLLVIFFFVLMVGFSHLFLPNYVKGIDIEIFSRRINKDSIGVQLYAYIIGFGSSLFFIPIAYFKLKEKQV